jgi:glycosyltransferase involved in cell wall biosynthesis
MDIHLVIPAYRESGRIGPFLRELMPALAAGPLKTSVLVVDDGSGLAETEKLRKVVAPFASEFPGLLQMLELPVNFGKGGAVRAGWDAAPPCEYLAFVDADGSISAGEVVRLASAAWCRRSGRTTLFASRIRMLGHSIRRSLFHHLAGRAFATVVGVLTDDRVYDSQCGCKFVPSDVYRSVRPVLRERGFAFDVELMAAILRSGNSIEEVPIDWHETPGTKVSFLRDAPRMALACAAIRRRSATWKFPGQVGQPPDPVKTATGPAAGRP